VKKNSFFLNSAFADDLDVFMNIKSSCEEQIFSTNPISTAPKIITEIDLALA
jgi:hypothetical protein